VGAQSALMWGQAAMLSSQQIETLSKYIEKEL
jgi:cytochrome c553